MTDEIDKEVFDPKKFTLTPEQSWRAIHTQRAEIKDLEKRIKELEKILSDRLMDYEQTRNDKTRRFYEAIAEYTGQKINFLLQALWTADPEIAGKIQEELQGREAGIEAFRRKEDENIREEFKDIFPGWKNV